MGHHRREVGQGLTAKGNLTVQEYSNVNYLIVSDNR
jgi:hypothetical protein